MKQNIIYTRLSNVIRETERQNILWILSRSSLRKLDLVYPGVYRDLFKNPNTAVVIPNGNDYDWADRIWGKASRFDAVYGLGGGTAIDMAKYIAKVNNLPCIAIPSMLSTNVFATNKVATTRKGRKATEDGVLPETVYVDPWYLKESADQNYLGLVDVFSISTALTDWKLADEAGIEPIQLDFFNRANRLLKRVMENSADRPTIKQIVANLAEAGYITNDYGCGRPESGSEHIFAKELEERIRIPHALSVAMGIMLMRTLDGNPEVLREDLSRCFRQLGVFHQLKLFANVHPELRGILVEALVNLKPRPDRYTILDYKPLPTRETCEDWVDTMLGCINYKEVPV